MGNVGQTRGRTGNGSRWGLGLSRGFFHSLPRARKQMEKYKIYSGGKKPAEIPKPPARPCAAGRPHNATRRRAISKAMGLDIWVLISRKMYAGNLGAIFR